MKINLIKWLKMSDKQVLDKFSKIQRAIDVGKGDKRFIYIPGTRNDKILLVAHADTVWKNQKLKIGYKDGVYFSKSPPVCHNNKTYRLGIGADDRAGCALVWALQNTGHSLLITNAEEKGCIASTNLMRTKWGNIVNDEHNFMIQFDRRGDEDLVFYDVANEDFVQYCEKQTGYKEAYGTYTDICELCERIPGVNISTGYYNEHTSKETLVVKDWLRTYYRIYNWISKKELPKFGLEKDLCAYGGYGYMYGYNKPYYESNPSVALEQDTIVCHDCKYSMSETEWIMNAYFCVNCNTYI